MYRIRKFINHIYKTNKQWYGYINTYIHIPKYKYLIDNFHPLQSDILIYNKKLYHHYRSLHYVTKRKKGWLYNYKELHNGKITMCNKKYDYTRIKIVIIYNCILITYHNDQLISTIVITMKGDIFIF